MAGASFLLLFADESSIWLTCEPPFNAERLDLVPSNLAPMVPVVFPSPAY